jgi:hypothetical protein
LAEGLVAGDDEGSALVGLGDEFEEDVGLVLVLAGVADVVEDEDIVAVELGEGIGEPEVAAGGLEMLEEVGDALEAGAVAVGDEVVGDGGGEVGRSDAVGAEDEEVVGLLDPVATGGQFADAWLGVSALPRPQLRSGNAADDLSVLHGPAFRGEFGEFRCRQVGVPVSAPVDERRGDGGEVVGGVDARQSA